MGIESYLVIASIEAVRPVFMIVMGGFLMLIAWRLSRVTAPWTSRILVSGAFLLGTGYALILPMYDAGILQSIPQAHRTGGNVASAVAWHCVKVVVMNGGWLFFGIGLAMHTRLFSAPARAKKAARSTATTSALATNKTLLP